MERYKEEDYKIEVGTVEELKCGRAQKEWKIIVGYIV